MLQEVDETFSSLSFLSEKEHGWRHRLDSMCQKEGGDLKCPTSWFGQTAARKLQVFETFHTNLHRLWDAGIIVDTKLPKHITAKTLFDNNYPKYVKKPNAHP